MAINPKRVRELLQTADFTTLCIEELGWDRQKKSLDVQAHGAPYHLAAAAGKRDFTLLVCSPTSDGKVPDYPTRRKIEREVSRQVPEHMIVFTDAGQSVQVWQWVKRELGSPNSCREVTYYKGQSGEALVQRLARLEYD